MIIAHKGRQATEELCWPGIFWYAKILRQIVVSTIHQMSLKRETKLMSPGM